jgi:phosphatidylglycerophosphate synthase
LLVIALAALVGGFMVSYASSVLRELGVADVRARMRRAHRLAYLLGSALLVPFVQAWLPLSSQRVKLAPVFVALTAIAVVGNVSAVQRLLGASCAASRKAAEAPSATTITTRRLSGQDAGKLAAPDTPPEARERAVQS